MKPGLSIDTIPALYAVLRAAASLETAGRKLTISPAAENVAACALQAIDLITQAEAFCNSLGIQPEDARACSDAASLVKLIVERK